MFEGHSSSLGLPRSSGRVLKSKRNDEIVQENISKRPNRSAKVPYHETSSVSANSEADMVYCKDSDEDDTVSVTFYSGGLVQCVPPVDGLMYFDRTTSSTLGKTTLTLPVTFDQLCVALGPIYKSICSRDFDINNYNLALVWTLNAIPTGTRRKKSCQELQEIDNSWMTAENRGVLFRNKSLDYTLDYLL